MDKFVGKRLDGRYEIKEIIGVGGMAVVYKAHDNQENRTVAIKILKDEFTSNEEFIRRFTNESKAIAMLSHPNIVKVYDVSIGDLIQYIVMEYIDGITLKEYIERQGSLRWKDAVHFTLQILKALQHAHDKGIVHRDVKPQNIMVLSDGTIKVTDFGIARFARSEQRTITDKAIGSVHYISPEQARGEKTDEKADLYSVGVMLYEMTTGQLPFQAESAVSVAIMQLQRDPKLPTELNASIPLGLEQITMHAMQKNSNKRYQSASEMLCDLDQFRKDPSTTFEYSYFVDTQPTKYVGGTPTEAKNDAPAQKKPDELKENNNFVPVLAGIATTLGIAIIVLAGIFIPKLFSDTGKEFKCPDFVGQTQEEVENNKDYNEKFEITYKQETDDADAGEIFKQSIAKGRKVKKGAKITLYVSVGKSKVKVPDVAGMTESQAVSKLKSMGFVVAEEPEHVFSEDFEKGHVVKTKPAIGKSVEKGSGITVFVSDGKEVKNVEIPNVVGLKSDEAKARLEKLNLVVEVKEKQLTASDKYYEAGYIVLQDPANGTQIPEGSTVVIYVSSGSVEYGFNVTVNLPNDYAYDTGLVSLWDGSQLFSESGKINIKETGSFTFKNLTSQDATKTLIVELSKDGNNYEKYMEIKVDCKTGKYNTVKTYSNYSKK